MRQERLNVRIGSTLCGVLLAALSFSSAAFSQDSTCVLAVVNDDIITTGDLRKFAGPTIQRIERQYSGPQLEAVKKNTYHRALQHLIDQRLMIQEAKRMIAAEEVEPRLIDRNIDNIIKDLIVQAGSLLQLKKLLAKGGETLEEKKERTRDEILVEMVKHRHVRNYVSVSPKEVRDYYLKHIDDYTRVTKVKSRQLLLPFSAQDSPEKTKALAESLHKNLLDGADFAALAKKYSQGPHASQGGLWDFMKRPAFGGAVDEALFSLKKGEISPVIDTKQGYQMLQIVDIQAGGKVPFEEVTDEITRRLEGERLKERYKEFITELRAKAHIVTPGHSFLSAVQ